MAFDATKFGQISAHSNSNLPRIWGYNTGTDTVTDGGNMVGAGYFNDKARDINVGDLIVCVLASGAGANTFQCTANTGTVVSMSHRDI
jgi:hypothetical protein